VIYAANSKFPVNPCSSNEICEIWAYKWDFPEKTRKFPVNSPVIGKSAQKYVRLQGFLGVSQASRQLGLTSRRALDAS
jgi:hypothetical protein